jgi:hypothetical protein
MWVADRLPLTATTETTAMTDNDIDLHRTQLLRALDDRYP